jgi:hypothetical protein
MQFPVRQEWAGSREHHEGHFSSGWLRQASLSGSGSWLRIARREEVAFSSSFISHEALCELANRTGESGCGDYLRELVRSFQNSTFP